jgi:4-oxalmesaconate hydratase
MAPIIDCHGHYTTTPPGVAQWRDAQKAAVTADSKYVGEKGTMVVSDDEIRHSLESAQLKLQRERGTDLTIFSPRASWMGHHLGNEHTSRFWTEHQNELIRRVCDLYPQNFAPVCQLPQSPGAPIAPSVTELVRCVEEMGFIGCNVNPDPTGGFWTGDPLNDPYWWPLWEKLCEFDVPAMVHVSAACNDQFHTTGSHYLGADTTAFMQALSSGFLRHFPALRLIIPHGGGAVPYHWGRFRGLANDAGWDFDEVVSQIWFDTCVYHQPGIDLLVRVVPTSQILFASEMVGAVRGIDPETGHYFDDTKRYIDDAAISDEQRRAIFTDNVQRVFPRLQLGSSAEASSLQLGSSAEASSLQLGSSAEASSLQLGSSAEASSPSGRGQGRWSKEG